MEDWVDGVHTVRQPEGEWMSTYLGNFLKGPRYFSASFLDGSDVIRLNEYLISNREVWSQSLTFVSRGGILHLCCGDGIMELEMEFVKIYNKILCSEWGEVSFQMYWDVGVVTLVGKEWCGTGSGIRSVIVCKFCCKISVIILDIEKRNGF